jgi:hypothetical protein
MGGVSDSVNVGRASPASQLASQTSAPGFTQSAGVADGIGIPEETQEQAASSPSPSPPPSPMLPLMQALAQLQAQAHPESAVAAKPEPSRKDSSAQSAASRQLLRARRAYSGSEEPAPLISIVG